MLNKTYLFLFVIVFTLLGFTAAGHAAAVIDPATGDGPGLQLARIVYDAIAGGHFAYAASMLLVVGVALVRKYANVDFFHTDAGSALLVLGGSFGTAMVAVLSGGGAVTFGLLASAFTVAFTAAGGYTAVKKLIVEPLLPKMPAWLQTIVGYLFVHKSDPGNNQATEVVK